METAIDVYASDEQRILAQALACRKDALRAIRDWPTERLARHRVLSALARRARQTGDPVPADWRRAEAQAAAFWLILEATRHEVGSTLATAGVRWLPIKGCDVADRFYAAPESRPTTDLDVLVGGEAFNSARTALERAGWNAPSLDPRVERYRSEEGYAWPATAPKRPLLEVHFRLWGFVPEGLGEAVVRDAAADVSICGHRPLPADAYVLAALHLWLTPPPRQLGAIYDLERIAEDRPLIADQVASRAEAFGLHLPVCLAATAASRLFDDPHQTCIAERLGASLRAAERRVLKRLEAGGIDAVSTADVVLARLLARRPSRAGWRTVPRRAWAHPGVVAMETPNAWSWPRRRAVHLIRQLGFNR